MANSIFTAGMAGEATVELADTSNIWSPPDYFLAGSRINATN